MSLLTGRIGVVGTRAPAPAPEPPPPDRAAESLELSREILEYLRTPVEEHVKRTAGERLEAERQARERAEAVAQEQQRAAEAQAAALRAELDGLRQALQERDISRAEYARQVEDAGRRLQEAQAAAAARDRELEEARAALKKRAAAPPAPAPAPQPAPALKAEDISFELMKGSTGLLHRVVLRAKGYEDLAVEIERGGDNRIRSLKTKGAL